MTTTVYWQSLENGNWDSPDAWSDAALPGPTDAVVFQNTDAPYTVTYNDASSIWSLTTDDNTALDLQGGVLTLSGNVTNEIYFATIESEATLNSALGAGIELMANANGPSLTVYGAIIGGGNLIFGHGASAVFDSDDITNAEIDLTGGDGSLTLDDSLTFAGTFTLMGAGESIDLNGNTLTLTGAMVALDSAEANGYADGLIDGTVVITNEAFLSDGDSTLKVAAELDIQGTAVQEGDVAVESGPLHVESGGTYKIDNGSISVADDAQFTNDGALVMEAYDQAATISGSLFTDGSLTVAQFSGLSLSAPQSSPDMLQGVIEGGGTLEFGADAYATFDPTSLTVAFFTIDGGDDTITFDDNISYDDDFTLAGVDDKLVLDDTVLTLSGESNSLGGGAGTGVTGGRVLVSGAAAFGTDDATLSLTAGDDHVAAEISGVVYQDSTVNLDGALEIDSNGVYTIYAGNIEGGDEATVMNTGNLTVNGYGVTTIEANFVTLNTLTIEMDSSLAIVGDDSTVAPTELGGTINGGGVLTIQSAELLTMAGLSITAGVTYEEASGDVFEVLGTSAPDIAITNFGADDVIEVLGSSVTSVTSDGSSLDIVTDAASYDFDQVTFGEQQILGWAAWQDNDEERITFTGDSPLVVSKSNSTLYLDHAALMLAGSADTVDMTAGSLLGIEGDGAGWDVINGSGEYIALEDAQASVVGGDDTLESDGDDNQASLYDTSGAWDTFSGSAGVLYLTSAQVSVVGGGDSVTAVGGSENMASFYSSGASWDAFNGSSATLYLTSAKVAVTGGGDSVSVAGGSGNMVSFYNSGANWDSVTGSGATIYLTSSKVAVTGGGDSVTVAGGSANMASFYNSGATWDALTGSNTTIYVTSAKISVTGGGDSVAIAGGTGNVVSFYNSGASWDALSGAGATAYLTSAEVSVSGASETVDFASGSGNAVSFYNSAGTWDALNGSGGAVYLSSAEVAVNGGGDVVNIAGGSGNKVSFAGSNGNWDGLTGSGATVYVSAAQVAVTGGSDVIAASSGSSISIAGTNGAWDSVAGSDDEINVNSAQATITGSGDTIYANAGSSLSLTGAATADSVYASGATIKLAASNANLTGSDDFVYVSGTSALNVDGASDSFSFAQAMGLATVSGFGSTDVLHLSAADWTSFAALKSSGDLIQSGANTVIKLDGSDSVTLTHVTATSLTASNFYFS